MKKTILSAILAFVISNTIAASIAYANHHESSHSHTMQHPESSALQQVLDSQEDAVKARYQYRHPKETLEFFGIKPGMAVADVLPGGKGWYSKILVSYLGEHGHVLGVDYSIEMWPLFGSSDEAIEKRKSWASTWLEGAQAWRGDAGSTIAATTFGSFDESLNNSLDAVIIVRAMHHLSRFEDKGGFQTSALEDIFTALKAGGIVGVVQHQAYEDRPDDWATGNNGYIKKSNVIAAFEKAGFKLVADSDLNANPKDQAGEGEKVWRLPPSLDGADEDPELKKAMQEIGESNRMTLKFQKPVA